MGVPTQMMCVMMAMTVLNHENLPGGRAESGITTQYMNS